MYSYIAAKCKLCYLFGMVDVAVAAQVGKGAAVVIPEITDSKLFIALINNVVKHIATYLM